MKVAKIDIRTLHDFLEKLSTEKLSGHYEKGYSIYRDGLILLRTNFYEPYLKENYTYALHQKYQEHVHQVKFARSKEKPKIDITKVKTYDILIMLIFGYRETDIKELYKHEIINYHTKFLNDAIHSNNNVTQDNYIDCYFAVQNFACSMDMYFANQKEYFFQEKSEIKNFLSNQYSSQLEAATNIDIVNESNSFSNLIFRFRIRMFFWLGFSILSVIGTILLFLYFSRMDLNNSKLDKATLNEVNSIQTADSAKIKKVKVKSNENTNLPTSREIDRTPKKIISEKKKSESAGSVKVGDNNSGIINTGTIRDININTKDTGK